MKQNKIRKLWIIAESSLCLLPLGLLIVAPALDLDYQEKIWIMASCTISCFISALCLWLNKKQLEKINPNIFRQILWIIPTMQYAFLLIVLFKSEVVTSSLINIILGLLFIIMGNILPKSEPNPIFGVRTPWTLSNRENWIITARLTGYTWVIGGLLFWGLVLFQIDFPLNILLMASIALCPFLISWIVYRRQIKNSSWKIDLDIKDSSHLSLPVKTFLWILSIGFCIFLVVFGGRYSISIDKNNLSLNASLVSSTSFPLEKTESLILKDSDKPGKRNFGYSGFGINLGRYETNEYGQYTRFTSGNGPVIELKGDGKTVVFNYSEPDKTMELFEMIKQVLIELDTHVQVHQERTLSS